MSYGCFNQPRPIRGATITGCEAYGSKQWPFELTTTCQYDQRNVDQRCMGCYQQGDGNAQQAQGVS